MFWVTASMITKIRDGKKGEMVTVRRIADKIFLI